MAACDSPFYVFPYKGATEKVPVPCGRCPPCKMRRVNEWVFRLMQQEKVSDSAHFITLTYDTRYVPITDNGFMTLDKSAFPLYMKRLRKLTDVKLKYYAVGEYGSRTVRPHYHAIVFNVPDIQMFQDAWIVDGFQLGSVHVGQVTSDSIAYTMKYIDKAARIPMHSRDDRVPEFSLMSKGLGANYVTKAAVNYHSADLSRLYVTKVGGHRCPMPRYYRNKLFTDEQKRLQVDIITAAALVGEASARRQHAAEQVNFSYEERVIRAKHARYAKFYRNLKRGL